MEKQKIYMIVVREVMNMKLQKQVSKILRLRRWIAIRLFGYQHIDVEVVRVDRRVVKKGE